VGSYGLEIYTKGDDGRAIMTDRGVEEGKRRRRFPFQIVQSSRNEKKERKGQDRIGRGVLKKMRCSKDR
jgi:hypothetical protein